MAGCRRQYVGEYLGFNRKRSPLRVSPLPLSDIVTKMISAHPSVPLTQQSNQIVNLFNLATSPRSVPFEAKGRWVHCTSPLDIETHGPSLVSGWDFSGAQADASTLSRGTITFQE